VLLTLVERKSRYEIIMKIDGKQRQHVDKILSGLIEEIEDSSSRVFKSITSEIALNSAEFLNILRELLMSTSQILVHLGNEVQKKISTGLSDVIYLKVRLFLLCLIILLRFRTDEQLSKEEIK